MEKFNFISRVVLNDENFHQLDDEVKFSVEIPSLRSLTPPTYLFAAKVSTSLRLQKFNATDA